LKTDLYTDETLRKYLGQGFVVQTDNEKVTTLVRNRKVGIFWNLVLTLLTAGWWLIVWIYRVVTKSTVLYLYKDPALMPIKSRSALKQGWAWTIEKAKGLSSRSRIVLAGALGLILVIAFISNSAQNNNEQKLTESLDYSTWAEKLETPLETTSCDSLSQVITSGESINFAKSTKAKATKAVKTVTVWNAETYISKNKWVNEAGGIGQSFDLELKGVIEPILSTRVKSLANETASSSLFQRKSPWQSSFLKFALEDCDLKADYDDALDTVSRVQTSATSIRTAASNKPWYPKGFEVIGAYPDFAYDNISSSGCSYSFGSCAKFKIVSKTGCPSSLYVETNLLSNGAIVDWSNDTARGLAPGQVAILETTFTSSSNGDGWTFTDISCY
jgi:hypothetical protein